MLAKVRRLIALVALVAAPMIFFTPKPSFADTGNSCANSSWLVGVGYGVGCTTTAQCPSDTPNGCYFGGGVNISGYGIVGATIATNLGSQSCGPAYFSCAVGVENHYAWPGQYVTATCAGGGDAVYVFMHCFINLTPNI